MSDGERVTIYLIGQALSAPAASVVVIDEPELHLHRAIQALLWDQIEAARPDCTFVYITHDLEFAATRMGSRRVWLKEFDGTHWVWDELDTVPELPDSLAMQILGSRRPIMFVEGEGKSHDAAIYSALYPTDLVIPRQSCSKVIEATKAMKSLPAMHHLAVRGLVDRDRRSDEEISALKAEGVLVANVAEVENLLCIPEAILAVARQIKNADPPQAVKNAQAAILADLAKLKEQQSLARALAEIQYRLSGFGPKVANSNSAQLEADLVSHVKGIDVAANVAAARRLFDDVLARNDYDAALRFFNCKGNIATVAQTLAMRSEMYVTIVLGMIKEDSNGALASAMRRLIDG